MTVYDCGVSGNDGGGAQDGSFAGQTPLWFQNGGSKSQYMQQVLAWQNCYKAVQQQQDAAALNWLEFLDNNYLFFEALGGAAGAGFGLGLGGPLGAYLGAHIGLLSVDQFHTLIAIALTYYANLSPSPAAVAAACGPKPGN